MFGGFAIQIKRQKQRSSKVCFADYLIIYIFYFYIYIKIKYLKKSLYRLDFNHLNCGYIIDFRETFLFVVMSETLQRHNIKKNHIYHICECNSEVWIECGDKNSAYVLLLSCPVLASCMPKQTTLRFTNKWLFWAFHDSFYFHSRYNESFAEWTSGIHHQQMTHLLNREFSFFQCSFQNE